MDNDLISVTSTEDYYSGLRPRVEATDINHKSSRTSCNSELQHVTIIPHRLHLNMERSLTAKALAKGWGEYEDAGPTNDDAAIPDSRPNRIAFDHLQSGHEQKQLDAASKRRDDKATIPACTNTGVSDIKPRSRVCERSQSEQKQKLQKVQASDGPMGLTRPANAREKRAEATARQCRAIGWICKFAEDKKVCFLTPRHGAKQAQRALDVKIYGYHSDRTITEIPGCTFFDAISTYAPFLSWRCSRDCACMCVSMSALTLNVKMMLL